MFMYVMLWEWNPFVATFIAGQYASYQKVYCDILPVSHTGHIQGVVKL